MLNFIISELGNKNTFKYRIILNSVFSVMHKSFLLKIITEISKNIFINFFVIYFCIVSSTFSEKIFPIGEDYLFQEFLETLRTDWKMKIENNILIFQRIEPVYVLPTNKMSMKNEILTEEKRILKFKKLGMKQNPYLKFQIQKKLNVFEDVENEVKTENLKNQIESYKKKYLIYSIIDSKNSTKDFEIYKPITKKQKINLKKFLSKKTILEKQIPKNLDYIFDKYGLVLLEKMGMSSQYTDVFPDSVIGEFLQIEKSLLKYKQRQPE